MSDQYSISELAREFGITTRTIRFYEEKGFLQPQRQGQNRIYSARDRTTLKLILRGKRLGFSLEQSYDIIAMYDPNHHNRDQLNSLLAKIADKRRQLLAQQTDLRQMLSELEQAEQQCRTALQQAPGQAG